MIMHVLCVCTMGRNRSKYLAEYLGGLGYDPRYGGIGPCKIDPEPENPLKLEDLEWAEIIITARKMHKPILIEKYGVKNKKIIVLEVRDSSTAMSEIYPELKNMGRDEFNQTWTSPQLRKAIAKYLPLTKE